METTILQYVQSGGVLGLLLVIVLGGARGWWVYGWQWALLQKERDEWKALATGAVTSVKEIVESMEPLVEQIARRP